MYKRLISFLKKHNILYDYQFGFRENHSTDMALICLMEKLAKALDSNEIVIGLFLDLSKAFDTVNHEILLDKLNFYGIRGIALEWFRSYLSNRSQYVSYNSTNSNYKIIICGVLQGSILGPLLFLLYVNDLYNISKELFFILFADDTNVFLSHKDAKYLNDLMNNELKKVSKWFKVNKLSVNIKKTKFMVFTNRKRFTLNDFEISLDGQNITCVDKIKFLGVYIDHKLNWKFHINYISDKLAKSVGILCKARKVLTKSVLLDLYYAFCFPYFSFGNIVWASNYKTNIYPLVVLQKKLVRIINFMKPTEHTALIFKQMGILNVLDINKFQVCMFMFKAVNKQLPGIFDSMFTSNKMIHNYNTRQSQNLHMPKCRTNFSKFCMSYRGPEIFNSLPNELKNIQILNKFKVQLKLHFIGYYI